MIIPAELVMRRMLVSETGLWSSETSVVKDIRRPSEAEDGFACYVKLPIHTLRVISRVPALKICGGVYEIYGKRLCCLNISVGDETDFPLRGQQFINRTEQHLLTRSLELGHTPVMFFDDVCRPYMRGTLVSKTEDVRRLASIFGGDCEDDPEPDHVEAAIERFSEDLFSHSFAGENLRALDNRYFSMDVEASNLNVVGGFFVGGQTILSLIENEGKILELTALEILQKLYGSSAYGSASLKRGRATRELIDVFAFADQQAPLTNTAILVEAKALSDKPDEAPLRSSGVIKRLEADIEKGLAQLTGATRSLQRGDLVYTSDGREQISLPDRPFAYFHCILLLSAMHPMIGWDGLFRRIYTSPDNVFFHVLDLGLLHKLAFDDHEFFETALRERWEVLKKGGPRYRRLQVMPPLDYSLRE